MFHSRVEDEVVPLPELRIQLRTANNISSVIMLAFATAYVVMYEDLPSFDMYSLSRVYCLSHVHHIVVR